MAHLRAYYKLHVISVQQFVGQEANRPCLACRRFHTVNLDCEYEAREDGLWLGEMIGLSELYTDTLLVLDCILDRDLELVAHIHTSHNPSFEIIAAKYSHPDMRPGTLLGNLATVLEDAVSSNEYPQRRASFTTFTLNQSLSKAVEPSSLQGVLLWTSGIANDLINRIVIEGSKSPLFEIGEFQELGSCHFVQLYKSAELLYKSEITEVSKVSMLPGMHQFGKGDTVLTCAVKQLRPRYQLQASSIERLFVEELQVLRYISSWRHEHILEFLAAFKVPSDGRFGSYALILPYADGGSLHEFLRLSGPPDWLRETTSSADTCDIVYSQTFGLLDALTLIHSKLKSSNFIIHRDIKSSNILIQNGTFKLADFGLARIKALDETSKTDWYAGTPMYAPPERTVGGEAGFGRARDAWAMGCVLLEILILLCHGFSRMPEVENFEQERLKSSGEREVRAFSLTMGCVSDRLVRLDAMTENTEHPSDREKLKTMLAAVRGMLCLDPAERMTSLLARDKLQEQLPNYQLRLPLPSEEVSIETYSTKSFTRGHTSRAFMTYFKRDGSATVDAIFVKPADQLETVKYHMVLGGTDIRTNKMSHRVQRALGLKLESRSSFTLDFMSKERPLGKVTVRWRFADIEEVMYTDIFYVFETDQYETMLMGGQNGLPRRGRRTLGQIADFMGLTRPLRSVLDVSLHAPHSTEKINRQLQIDAGIKDNIIADRVFRELPGAKLEPNNGYMIDTAAGPVYPRGKVDVEFHIHRYAKTYNASFWVVDTRDIDTLVGSEFLKQALG
ncbi:MAG: hypothetical protein M1813_008309 [Trichoglossum hirsutum]|nr:MAG: hypothetical protein M1813_008309 [Trichoglossum hirsutum]